MTLKDRYWFGGFSGTPPSEPNLSTPPPPPPRVPNAWKCESPENEPLSRGAAKRAEPRPWEAMNGLKLRKFWKWWSMVPGTAKSAKKMVMLRNGFLGNLLKWYARNGNSWLKMGVLFAAHTQYAYNVIWKYPPPGFIALFALLTRGDDSVVTAPPALSHLNSSDCIGFGCCSNLTCNTCSESFSHP